MIALSAALRVAVAAAVAAPPAPEEVIGGYYERSELREPEPEDGEGRVMIGSILLSLGALRVGVSAGSIVTMAPGRCQEIYGAAASERTCAGLRTYGYVGVGYGSLMVVTGAVFLGWGLVLRGRYQSWARRRGVAIAPLPLERGAGVGVGLRF